jgi:hypothetical protein
VRGDVMGRLFQDMQVSWLYSSAVQSTLNGSRPAWTLDEWSFVPLDLTSLPVHIGQDATRDSVSDDGISVAESWAEFDTQAIRARLECTPYDLFNTTRWASEFDLSNESAWNVSMNPSQSSRGWELGAYLTGDEMESFQMFTHYDDPDQTCPMYNYTSFYSNTGRLVCCENATDESIGLSSAGYWAGVGKGTMNLTQDLDECEDELESWEIFDFSVKWIRGRAIENYFRANDTDNPHMIWSELPEMAASSCAPIIETTDARVRVDLKTGAVLNYDLLHDPSLHEWAWTDNFESRRENELELGDSPDGGLFNVTTSYGVLFATALSLSAQLENMETISQTIPDSYPMESFVDRTFKIRGPGLNVDYMTYTMLKMVNDDHDALLDSKTLHETASKAFSTFFQHFVHHNLSMSEGGMAYQRLGERIPSDIGNSSATAFDDAVSSYPAGAQVEVQMSVPVEVLEMSQTAAIICLVLLTCLIAISVVLGMSSRRQQHLILRRIESFADVALLFAGSDRLLQLLRNPGVTDEVIMRSKDLQLKLGWFTAADRTRRWGIELVGLTNGVPVTDEGESGTPSAPGGQGDNKFPGEQVALLPTPLSESGGVSPMESISSPQMAQAIPRKQLSPTAQPVTITERPVSSISERPVSPIESENSPQQPNSRSHAESVALLDDQDVSEQPGRPNAAPR